MTAIATPPATSAAPSSDQAAHELAAWVLEDRYEPAAEQLERFERFCERIGLELEPFQRLILLIVFGGVRELLALLPKGNGKTSLFAALALFHLGTVDRAFVPIGASTSKQAGLLYAELQHFAKVPAIAREITVQRGYQSAKNDARGGHLQVFSSDGGAAHGPGPTLALLDELWAHRSRHLYTAFRSGLGKRRGQLVNLSTAGTDEESPLGQLRREALKFPRIRQDDALTIAVSRNGLVVMLEWACGPEEDLADPAVLKRANPASFVTEEWLAEEIEAPGVQPFEVAQFHGNVWSTAAPGCWVRPQRWRQRANPDLVIPDGQEVLIGLDIAHVWDTTAIQPYWKRDGTPDRPNIAAHSRVVAPPGDGTAMRLRPIAEALIATCERWQVRGVVLDRWGAGEPMGQLLEDEYDLDIIPYQQKPEPLALAAGRLLTAIDDGGLVHDGNPDLTAHSLAAVPIRVGERSWRLGKPARPRNAGPDWKPKPIDCVVALAMVNAVALAGLDDLDDPFVEVIT